ncbi:hypothetical protein SAZ10_00310 [Mesorhizobium sp. BAC0120]|uniref:hypothetical protein n=1 Tax=Mesorhizobium sp. BAC0120 TaxID=3090670 RepID=UPI00298C7CC6|nr:hypothetical protein [Mesorhizobium sp. BAC0120]MDW6020198.1 hypothetical protein [Mesorhizobium sp. BAC0120]
MVEFFGERLKNLQRELWVVQRRQERLRAQARKSTLRREAARSIDYNAKLITQSREVLKHSYDLLAETAKAVRDVRSPPAELS